MQTLRIVLVVLLLVAAREAAGQSVATPGNHLGFDVPGQTVAVASASTYTAYLDTATTGVALTNVFCTAQAAPLPVTCVAPWPAMQPGTHTLTLTQEQSGVESPKSAPLAFTMAIVVTPTNVRQVP